MEESAPETTSAVVNESSEEQTNNTTLSVKLSNEDKTEEMGIKLRYEHTFILCTQ